MKLPKQPSFILVVAALVLVTAHSQLTLRQFGLRVAGVREGDVHHVLTLESYVESTPRFDSSRLRVPEAALTSQLAVLHDSHATFLEDELSGKRIFLEGATFDILANTATYILVRCDDISDIDAALTKTSHYITGVTKKSHLVNAALRVPGINVTISDLLLALLVVLLILDHLRRRTPLSTFIPPLPGVIFIGIGIISLIPALRVLDTSYVEPKLKVGLVEVGQFIEVLVIGYWCSVRLLHDEANRRRFHLVLVAMTGLVVCIGLVEYCAVFSGRTLRGLLDAEAIDSIFGFRYNSPRAWSTGTESNRNILALYLTLTFPFSLMAIKHASTVWQKIASAIIAIGSLLLIMNLALLVIVVIAGVLVVYFYYASKGVYLYALTVLITVSAICLINEHHGRLLIDSVAYSRTTDTYGLQPMPLKGTSFEGQAAWQQKYLEKQASLNAISYSPLFGVGIGNYQLAINSFYENSRVQGHALVKDPVNLMERNSHSLFQVLSVETGLIGAISLGLCLVLPLLSLGRAMVQSKLKDPMAIAVSASVLALLVGSFYVSFMVRGVQLIAIAIVGCATAISRHGMESNKASEGDEDK